ncbi:hypothetical protein [Gloeocapsa sp. PCC 73106]|uniref:hypothetical protein n=1 Tax=Gloeocapsa sp. PCC 73106 TaxID=102232 RepID=UPI0002AB9F71|nr:hypothetical protein [Gloeocapsa sp. PCC 73106]ELR99787.1 hypothetical protein GLO73106DRAFT_00036390 [Gloeocapsa sp. PCC 73106]
MKDKLVNWLNRLLVANVFLVMIGFLWFAIALIGRSLGIPLGWELWYKLWLPLFNPAIAILIGGAILNWAIGKIQQRFN